MEGGRGGEKKKLLSPPPPPSFLFFCSRPNFPPELARKHLLCRLVPFWFLKLPTIDCLVCQCLMTYCYLQPCCVVVFLVVDFNGLVFLILLFV